jgi:hypothetical protein
LILSFKENSKSLDGIKSKLKASLRDDVVSKKGLRREKMVLYVGT